MCLYFMQVQFEMNLLRCYSIENNCDSIEELFVRVLINIFFFQVLELVGNVSKDLKVKRIILCYLQFVIRGDEELDFLIKVIIVGGGTYLFIFCEIYLNLQFDYKKNFEYF